MCAASYKGLIAASPHASKAARGSSKKHSTTPEVLLRKALRQAGLRSYRLTVAGIAGRPDIVFARAKVVVFCDGDFWHGRELEVRIGKLKAGHNALYWIAKIESNVARDRRRTNELESAGWTVLRFWESTIKADPDAVAKQVRRVVARRLLRRK